MTTIIKELVAQIIEQGLSTKTFDSKSIFLESPIVVRFGFQTDAISQKTELVVVIDIDTAAVNNYVEFDSFAEYVTILQEAKQYAQMLKDYSDLFAIEYDKWVESVKTK